MTLHMTTIMIRLLALICVIPMLALADPTVSFQTHYLPLGPQDSSVAIAADGAGNVFIVLKIVDSSGKPSVRVMKTDPNGKIMTHFDFGQGVTPAGAAIGVVSTSNRKTSVKEVIERRPSPRTACSSVYRALYVVLRRCVPA